MKSTTMRVRRALPVVAISMLAIVIGIISVINVKTILDKASAATTRVEVTIQGEVVLPTISNVSPNHGSAMGGTLLTFTGFNLNSIASITVGGAECRPVDIISPEEITCTTTAHVPGLTTVLMRSGDGTILAELDGAFTYDPIIPIPPETGGEDDGGVLAPDTGMFLLGSSDKFTYLDYILVSFIVVAIIGIIMHRMCIVAKRKKIKKSTNKRKAASKKPKSRKK